MVDDTSIPPDEQQATDQAKQDRRKERFEQERKRATWLGNGTAVLDGRMVRFLTDDVRELMNGVVRICGQTMLHDGLESSTELEIEVRLASGRALPRFAIKADDLPRIEQWLAKHCGGLAVLSPVRGDAGYLRSAMQNYSIQQGIEESNVYTFVGWLRINGEWFYLHAGGGMGATCNHEEIRTRLDGNLGRIELESVLGAQQLHADCRQYLRLLDVAPLRISAPLFAVPPASVLSVHKPTNSTMLLHGLTGSRKTENAALVQGCFGRTLDSDHIMASALSTPTYLETTGFAANNVPFVIDDYAPDGTRMDRERKRGEMERTFRMVGNQQGKGRARPDGSVAPSKWIRGFVLATAEHLNFGHSVTARMSAIEVKPGDVRLDVLTDMQAARADGSLVRVTTAFIRYMAGHWEEIRDLYLDRHQHHTDALRHLPVAHSRHPAMLATLLAAVDVWCDVMVRMGGISAEEATSVRARMDQGIDLVGGDQVDVIEEADPVVQFLGTVRAAVSAGRAHLAGMDNEAPKRASALGWRRESTTDRYGVSVPGFKPLGERIGWIDDRGIFLIPEASLAVVQAFGREQGISIPWTHRTLGKRLAEAGHILSSESNLNTQKISVAGSRVRAWHVATSHLLDLEPSEQTGFITDFPTREGAA